MTAAGVRFVGPVRDGARITGWLPLDPKAVIGKCIASFGWRVDVFDDVAASPATQERFIETANAFVAGLEAGLNRQLERRVGDRRHLQLVTNDEPPVQQVPGVEAGHGGEGTTSDHGSVTGASPDA